MSELGRKLAKSLKGGHPKFFEIVDEIALLHDKKNTDYAAGLSQGPLGNFHRVSEFKKMYPGFDWESPFGTAIDFMLKQLDAMMILRATKRQSITGEPIGARLRDIAIYSIIAEILESEEPKPQISISVTAGENRN
jgi:hypothetical protein